MHKITIYPVGNGDTSQITLKNNKRILFDFRHQIQGENEDHPVIDLKKQLLNELAESKRDYFDVVAFTHGDKDHIDRSTEFFELWHAKKYQGEGRIKINELWVPAAMILDTATNDKQSNEFVIWRQEARHRLIEGKGIQVFSKPDKLKKFLEDNGLTVESRQHLITDAGKLAKGFSLQNDGVEFFCHSPFIKHVDYQEDIARNEASLVFQVRFEIDGTQVNYLAVGDSTYDVLDDIVRISQFHKRDDRLNWDIFNIPHHCSWRVLGPEKGDKETIPSDQVKELLLHGQPGAFLVSSSNPIPNTDEAYTQDQPPHIQAKNTYKKFLRQVGGNDFLVSMEEPNEKKPEPLVFEISGKGVRRRTNSVLGSAAIISSIAPRAGNV